MTMYLAVGLLVAASLYDAAHARQVVYVSCLKGSDENPGTADAPFRTLKAARDAVRSLRQVTSLDGAEVRVMSHMDDGDLDAGRCELATPLELDHRDSNVQWVSHGGSVLVSGGVRLDRASFVSSGSDGVVTIDLRSRNLTDFGKLRGRGYAGGSGCILTQNYEPSALEMFYRDVDKTSSEERQMVLARYPDITYPVSKSNWIQVGSVKGNTVGVPSSLIARMRKWQNESIWTHGLWKWNWADSHRPVLSYSASSGSLTLGNDDINRDVPLSKGGNFYVYNALSELDQPGEYHVDPKSGILSFLPPAVAGMHGGICSWSLDISRSDQGTDVWKKLNVSGPSDDVFVFSGCTISGSEGKRCADQLGVKSGVRTLKNKAGDIVGTGVCCNSVTNRVIRAVRGSCTGGQPGNGTYHVSMASSVLSIKGATDITFTGFEFRYTRGPGVVISDSSRVIIRDGAIGDVGMMALNITGGIGCGLESSSIEGSGDSGVVLDGGNRLTLEPGNHFVRNSSLHHNQRWIMNYAPHVLLAGVGNIVEKSELFNAPQIAIFMQGNDHALQDSYIHDAAQQCSDCGAFYAGREWTYRGNVIKGNTWRRMSSIFEGFGQGQAIYLDDMLSSVTITDNVFDGVATVLELGGGRGNVFERNFINASSNTPVHFDNRGQGWDKGGCKAGGLPYEFLKNVPYATSDAWKKYPGLGNILNDAPCEPRHNVISNNVMCNGPTTLVNQGASTISKWHSTAENNTVCASTLATTAIVI